MGTAALVEEAIALGYSKPAANQAMHWSVARIVLRNGLTAVTGITGEQIAEVLEAIRLFPGHPTPEKLPYVPTEAEISAFYDAVWKARRAGDVVLIKTLYARVRVAELVRIRLADLDLDACRIRITQAAGITASISPHTLRHFLFAWLKSQGIDDALIQPYSGHATRQSLEIYSRLALADAQQRYDDVIGNFPV